jgi:methionine synthase II (cobalamin-independent)
VSIDQDQLSAGDYEALAQAAEAGKQLWLGCLPTNDPSALPSVDQLRQRVLGVVERIAVSELPGQLLLTPACGLAGFPTSAVKEAFVRLDRAASQVSAELGVD